jgi:hypothetical protein
VIRAGGAQQAIVAIAEAAASKALWASAKAEGEVSSIYPPDAMRDHRRVGTGVRFTVLARFAFLSLSESMNPRGIFL